MVAVKGKRVLNGKKRKYGVNDADYVTAVRTGIGGNVEFCPFYLVWKGMIERCYSERVHSHHKNYIGCSVYDDWIYFSNFKAWMEQQDWQGKQLDKDLIFKGNKLYSPDTCIFIPAMVNSFISSDTSKNDLPVGVQQDKHSGSYYATCSMLGKGRKRIGSFATIDEASLAYKKFKKEIAFILIEEQTD